MSTPTARAAYCPHCESAIWHQAVPFSYRVDTEPLQSASEELVVRLWGRQTYQVFKTGVTFELVPRTLPNLDGDYVHKIVLADHTCHRLIRKVHPEYWPTTRKASRELPDF